MLCEEIMHRDVECVSEDDVALVAAEKMRRAQIGFLPVCDGSGRMVGALTDRDITVRLVAEDRPTTTRVRSIMTNEVVTCRPNDDLHHAEQLMADKHRSRIVCTDAKGCPVGVISLSDVAQWEPERAPDLLRAVSEREA
jgi:CBS domain-containing protein